MATRCLYRPIFPCPPRHQSCCYLVQAGSDSAPTRDGVALLPPQCLQPLTKRRKPSQPVLFWHWLQCDFFFWTQSGEIKKATAAEIQIQGSCYNGWYHPKYLKQHQLCSLFSVRCLWRCPQWTGCPWSAVEEPWYAQLPGKEKVCAISKVLSCYRVSSVTSRNQGHSSGSHRLRLLRRNFLLCCFWNIYCLDQTLPGLTSEAMGGHIHPENVSTVPDLDFEHPISQSIKSLQHYYF